MMGLAPHIGRQQAHDVVYDACRTVNENGGTLAEALAALPEVTQHFDRAAIDRLTDPANYLGLAPQMVDRALALSARRRRDSNFLQSRLHRRTSYPHHGD